MKKENRLIPAVIVISFLAAFLPDGMSVGAFLLLLGAVAACQGILAARGRAREERRFVLLCGCMVLFTAGVLMLACRMRGEGVSSAAMAWEGAAIFLAVLGWGAYCLRLEGGVTEDYVALILFGGFLARLFYAMMIPAHLLQNDLGWLEPDNYGHLGYVYHLFAQRGLPDVNPMEHYQYYQPPLHHAVSAVLTGLYSALGYEMAQVAEQLQMLSVMYGALTLIFLNKIGIRLGITAFGRGIAMGLASFLPFGIMTGAALNNDGLMLLLVTMALYYTLVWYRNPGYGSSAAMALCIGGAMMAKLSGALAAPAMALLMLHRAWRERAKWRDYLKQFLLFGAIAFPLGLWHSVLRFVQYGMPFGFVPSMARDNEQYIGMYGKWSRFLDFRGAFSNLSIGWSNVTGADHNIPVAVVKFAAFGEADYYRDNQAAHIVGTAMFWATFALLVLMAVAFVLWFFQRRYGRMERLFLGTVVIVHMCSYVMFCLSYPFVCTMNIRYVMAALNLVFLMLGAAAEGLRDRLSARRRRGTREMVGLGLAGAYVAGAVTLIVLMNQVI